MVDESILERRRRVDEQIDKINKLPGWRLDKAYIRSLSIRKRRKRLWHVCSVSMRRTALQTLMNNSPLGTNSMSKPVRKSRSTQPSAPSPDRLVVVVDTDKGDSEVVLADEGGKEESGCSAETLTVDLTQPTVPPPSL